MAGPVRDGGGSWVTTAPWQADAVVTDAIVAATGDRDAAAAAWRRWLASTDFDRVDQGSCHALPLVQHNLSRLGLVDGHDGRLRGIARRTWVAGQVVQRGAEPAIDALVAAGIDVATAGDAAAAPWYPEPSTRAVDTVELLVRENDLVAAAAVMVANGWRLGGGADPSRIAALARRGVAGAVTAERDAVRVVLRWHLRADCLWAGADDGVWHRARAAAAAHRYDLHPADLLVAAVAGGLRGDVAPAVWITDALVVLRSGDVLVTDALDVAREARMAAHLRQGADHLATVLPDSIAVAAFAAALPTKPGLLDRLALVEAGRSAPRRMHPRRVATATARALRSTSGTVGRARTVAIVAHVATQITRTVAPTEPVR